MTDGNVPMKTKHQMEISSLSSPTLMEISSLSVPMEIPSVTAQARWKFPASLLTKPMEISSITAQARCKFPASLLTTMEISSVTAQSDFGCSCKTTLATTIENIKIVFEIFDQHFPAPLRPRKRIVACAASELNAGIVRLHNE